jgi:hypothetical protein
MKKTNKSKPSRRQFLRGAAGFSLALPFLDSLAPKSADAGDPPYAANPRFVAMTTQHGGVWGQNMWPDDAVAANSHNLYGGHTAYHGTLSPSVSNGSASLSPVLTGDSALLTSAIAAKMNLVRGLDVPHYLGHNTGGELGNFAAEGDFINPEGPVTEPRATIDQVMAQSQSFYPDLGSIRQRSLHIGTHSHHSWGYANPEDPTSAVQATPLSQSSQALFDQIFVPENVEENPRPLVVDRVLEHYSRLRSGSFGDASRLSSSDAQRLDDHMDRLRDLQTRLNAVADCSDVQIPTGDTNGLDVGGYSNNVQDMRSYYQLYNDVIVAAVKGPIAKGAYWFNQNVLDKVIDTAGETSVKAGQVVYDKIDQGLIEGAVNGAGFLSNQSGQELRRMQTGKVQQYAALLFAGAAILAGIFIIFV